MLTYPSLRVTSSKAINPSIADLARSALRLSSKNFFLARLDMVCNANSPVMPIGPSFFSGLAGVCSVGSGVGSSPSAVSASASALAASAREASLFYLYSAVRRCLRFMASACFSVSAFLMACSSSRRRCSAARAAARLALSRSWLRRSSSSRRFCSSCSASCC